METIVYLCYNNVICMNHNTATLSDGSSDIFSHDSIITIRESKISHNRATSGSVIHMPFKLPKTTTKPIAQVLSLWQSLF